MQRSLSKGPLRVAIRAEVVLDEGTDRTGRVFIALKVVLEEGREVILNLKECEKQMRTSKPMPGL